MCHDKEKIVNVLQLLHNTKAYNINMILKYINLYKHGIKNIGDVIEYQSQREKLDVSRQIMRHAVTKDQLLAYIKKSCELYIYGAGAWGSFIYSLYFQYNNKCVGFIVSSDDDRKQESNEYWGKFIYPCKNNNKIDDKYVLVKSIDEKQKFYKVPIYIYNNSFDYRYVIVAMSFKNTKNLICQIGKKEEWLYLW